MNIAERDRNYFSRRGMAVIALAAALQLVVARGSAGAEVSPGDSPPPDATSTAQPGLDLGESPAAGAARPECWEFSPYRILVYVKIDSSPEWTPGRRAELPAEIENRSRNCVGGLWRIKAIEAPAELHWNLAATIGNVSTEVVPHAALEGDKVMLLGLAAAADGRQSIYAREFDVRTRTWGATLAIDLQPGVELADQIARALWQSFSPLVRIDELSDRGTVTARIRGGELPLASRSLELIQPGTVLRPLIRHFDAKGRTIPACVFPVQWTWLRVEEVDGATAKCRLEAGVQDPLELRYDGRTEYLGLAVSTRAVSSTKLILRARGSERPLEDLEVWGREAGAKLPRLIGRSDESGAVTVESTAIEVQTLFIRSGEDLLARFPLAPGVERSVTVQVEDNGRRLETGDLVARASDELLDLVAQHALLKIRFQREMVAGRRDAAAKTLATLKMLKTSDAFLKSLDARRAALPSLGGDAIAAAWLDKRLAEIRPLAAKLLSSQELARLEGLFPEKGLR